MLTRWLLHGPAWKYGDSRMNPIIEFFLVVFYSLIGRQDEILDRLSQDKPLGRVAKAEELINR